MRRILTGLGAAGAVALSLAACTTPGDRAVGGAAVGGLAGAGIGGLPVEALAANPPAIVHRLIRLAVEDEFGRTLSRSQTLAVARLVHDWHGQEGVDLPGITVVRAGGRLEFTGS